MSAYVGKFFTAVSAALEFNTATLSGAIDILVIEDDSGRRSCSPFHVRFGKLQLLKSRGISVVIDLNGHRTPLRMLLGAAGEAYFYNLPRSSSADERRSPITSTPNMSIGDRIDANTSQIDLPIRSTTEPLSGSIALFGVATQPFKKSTSKELSTKSLPILKNAVVETTATDSPFGYISDSEVELTRNERDGTAEVAEEPRSPPLFLPKRKWSSSFSHKSALLNTPPQNEAKASEGMATKNLSPENDSADDEPISSAEDQNSALFGLPSSPSSAHGSAAGEDYNKDHLRERNPVAEKEEGLMDLQQDEESLTVSNSMCDVVGEEEFKLECRSVDGYDADEDAEDLRDFQEQVAYVLSRPSALSYMATDQADCSDEAADGEPLVEKDGEPLVDKDGAVAMSLCGKLILPDMEEERIMELFERHRVTYDEFLSNPNLLYDPSLLFRIDDRLVEFRVAAPFIFSVLAFNKRMDIDMLARITTPEMKTEPPKSPPTPTKRFGWFGWSSPSVVGEPLLKDEDLNALESSQADEVKAQTIEEDREETQAFKEVEKAVESAQKDGNELGTQNSSLDQTLKSALDNLSSEQGKTMKNGETTDGQSDPKSEDSQAQQVQQANAFISFADVDPEALSLRPTSEELNSLDLKPGANSIRFFVESSSVELNCRIFLWSCHTKIVISDVDGTITRSDVLGHLLPAVGRDWSQVGVAGLYSQIEKNGYKMLYLTARPIGQASQTRTFLHSVTQGSAKLPNGPVLMSPNRLVESFTREVIRRRPHEFKIGALREIRSLFPPDYNPFHAGFGNRDTDVISYRAVGLIPQRIFVVNPRGELVVMKAKYESTASYSTLQDLVESVFPDISGQDGLKKIKAMTESATFNDWNYWKSSLPEIDLDELLRPK